MNSSLPPSPDWATLAKPAGYSAQILAQLHGISLRQLERVFLKSFGVLPHPWLRQLRMQRALQLLNENRPIALLAEELCYKYPEHFARDFKAYYGFPPSKHRDAVIPNSVAAIHSSFTEGKAVTL
jgi:transcriptional regulator GlxA family with amidase domain